MSGLVAGGVGRLALAEAKSTLTGLPKWVYYAVGIALLLFLVIRWDAGRIKAAEKRGSDAAYASIEKQARAIEQKANRLTSRISTVLKDQNDETNRHISAGADTLRVRGPGAATCTSVAQLPAPAGQSEPSSGATDAPLGRVPYPKWSDLIAMPFGELIDRAEQCDLNRAEVLTWREWWKQQNANWQQLQSERTRP